MVRKSTLTGLPHDKIEHEHLLFERRSFRLVILLRFPKKRRKLQLTLYSSKMLFFWVLGLIKLVFEISFIVLLFFLESKEVKWFSGADSTGEAPYGLSGRFERSENRLLPKIKPALFYILIAFFS